MPLKNVLFRADASPEMGGGHIVRSIALAQEFLSRDIQCHLLTEQTSLDLFPGIGQYFSKIGFPLIRDHLDRHYDLLVLDQPDIDLDFETGLREISKKVFVLSDSPDRKLNADYLLDSNFGRKQADYQEFINEDCMMFLGSDFVPMRKELLGKAETIKDRILISVGFTDPADMVIRYVNALDIVGNQFPVDVVIGYAPETVEKVETIQDKLDFPMKVLIQPDDMGAIYQHSKFALGGGGSSVWERAALKIPSITVQIAENQRHLLESMNEIEALMHLGEASKLLDEDLQRAVKYALDHENEMFLQAEKAHNYCDGQGTSRIVDALLGC